MRRNLGFLARLALLLTCLFAATACDIPIIGSIDGFGASSTTAQQVTPLSGTSWTLTQLTIAGRSKPPLPTAPVTLQFQSSGGAYLGSSGCNYYNGDYTVSGAQLHLAFGAVTQRACAGPIMSQEVAYLNTMEQVRGFQVAGRMLTLDDDEGNAILVYMSV